jgi:hypothetical protein
MGAAVITEFPTVLIAVVLTAFVVWRARRRVLWFFGGAALPGLVGAAYNRIAFGSFRAVSYGEKHKAGSHRVFGLGVPSPYQLARIFFDQRGLLIATPIVVLAVVLAIRQARRPGPPRLDAIVALAIFGLFLALQASWPNPWGGDSPGPRYIIPALPFLAVPLAAGWNSVRRAAIAATAWGGICMALPVLFGSLVPKTAAPLDYWRAQLRAHEFVPTVWTMAFGPVGVVLFAGTVLFVIVQLTSRSSRLRS